MPRSPQASDRYIYSVSFRSEHTYLQHVHFTTFEMDALEWCMNRTGDKKRYSTLPIWRFIVRRHLIDEKDEYSKIVCIFNQAGNTVDLEGSGEKDEEWLSA